MIKYFKKNVYTKQLEFQGHVSCSNPKSQRMETFIMCMISFISHYISPKKCSWSNRKQQNSQDMEILLLFTLSNLSREELFDEKSVLHTLQIKSEDTFSTSVSKILNN